MSQPTAKLTLNQETLRNLTRDETQHVAGGFASAVSCHYTCGCPTGFTCPECAPQIRREGRER